MTEAIRHAEVEILKYLLANQDARDTMEGVEKWWLPQSRHYGMADIAAALRDLEERGIVRVWHPAAAQPIYGRSSADPVKLEEYLQSIE